MGVKDNFNQAVHEVFPFYKNAKANGEKNSPVLSDPADGKPEGNITLITTATAPRQTEPEIVSPEQPEVETAYITKDTKITGTIVSMSNIDVCGEIIGDIESQHGLKISGKVEGSVKGKNVDISNATIKGNIHAAQRLCIENKSIVVGNIFATELEFCGRINGDINVKKDITVRKESYITGDISAVSISIEKGAMIKGMVTTLSEMEGKDSESPV